MTIRRIATLLLALALAACASVEDALPPTVELTNVRVGQVGLLSQELQLELKVGNPNDFDLPLSGLTFAFEVNGIKLAEGLSNADVSLPRLGYATVPVSGTTDTLNLLREIMRLGDSDRLHYRLHGIAYFGRFGQNRRVPYERRGELSLLPGPRKTRPGGFKTLVPVRS